VSFKCFSFFIIVRGFKGDSAASAIRSHTSAGALVVSLSCSISRKSQCSPNGTILSTSRTQIASSGTEGWDTSIKTNGTDGSPSWSAGGC